MSDWEAVKPGINEDQWLFVLLIAGGASENVLNEFQSLGILFLVTW